MKILKYIINEKKIPILFSTEITHCDVLSKAISAGFLTVKFDTNYNKFLVKCYGESSSLNIKTSNEDESLIENYLNNQFYTVKK
nr:hypothetical protein [uncultured Flavobacterium sp.]